MPKLYADLHCHPTLYNFNRMRNHPTVEDNPELFTPWQPGPSSLKHMDAGTRGSTYAQCDYPKLAKADVRLVFASITPIEKEFFGYLSDDERHRPFIWELLRWILLITPLQALGYVLLGRRKKAFQTLVRILQNHGPLRRLIQRLVMGYGFKRIEHLQSTRYDYWDEYEREYAFYVQSDGQTHTTTLEYAQDGQWCEERITGRYELIREREQLQRIIESDEAYPSPCIATILTIEGSHVFTMDAELNRVPEDVLFARIEQLKTQEHPILFLTFAHHFNNGLCGHAHSLLDIAGALMDQSERMHEGFEKENDLGLRAVRALLDLNEQLEPLGGRRILLDIKHMSARTRQEYYAEIIRPHRAAYATWDEEKQTRSPQIPIVASHACYAGARSLDELMHNVNLEDDHWHAPPFYAWNINLCDEDIREIYESDGLIGLCFDQRVAGVSPTQRIPLEQWSFLVLQQLFAFADVILLDQERTPEEQKKAWDMLCLGTDYDGFIDPLTAYPTVLSLEQWADDLKRHLESYRHTRFIEEIGVDELVEKIAWRNAYEWTVRHWPTSPSKDVETC